jgi:hypothetical protein
LFCHLDGRAFLCCEGTGLEESPFTGGREW